MTIGLIYIGVFLLGVTYAFIAGVMGWLADLGEGDIQMDASGHLDAGHPHPVSGTTMATFITGFGGGGIIAHYLLEWDLLPGVAVAMGSGLAVAAAAYGVLEIIFKQTQAGSEFAQEQAVGREAEVITAIPPGGTGEIGYVLKGQRETTAARSVDGAAIPKGRLVVVDKTMGNTAYVRLKI